MNISRSKGAVNNLFSLIEKESCEKNEILLHLSFAVLSNLKAGPA